MTPDDPQVEPTVRELLLARIDSQVRLIGLELDQLATIYEQLHPERGRSVGTAIAMLRALLLEVTDRAHAEPIE